MLGPELRRRPAPLTYYILAGVQLLGALSCLAFALWPPSPRTPRLIDAIAGLVGLGLSAFTAFAAPRLGVVALEASLMVSALAAAGLTSVAATPEGQVFNGLTLVAGGILAAHLLERRGLYRFLAVMLGTYTVAVVTSPLGLGLLYVVLTSVIVVSASLATETLVERADRLALTDPLTGALNRNGLEETASRARALAARSGLSTVVVALDLDAFKAFNDEHGHAAGDLRLRDVVQAWRSTMRSSDLLCRIGGDEFLMVLPGTDLVSTDAMMARMLASVPQPFAFGSVVWQDGEDLLVAADRADRIMYVQKRARGERRAV